MPTKSGILYVVATPIGNLSDITYRAVETLREVDFVLAEDTRVTKKLLSHFGIKKPIERFDAKAEKDKTEEVVERIKDGQSAALTSDAGTPAISDPGTRLVRQARETGVRVEAIPGPSALAAALSVSGLSSDEFVFLGFPPHKKGRETFFKKVAEEKRTAVFYESPHRIMKTLQALKDVLSPERVVVVARELTKIYEEVVSGSAGEVLEKFENKPDSVKGEFVVMVSD